VVATTNTGRTLVTMSNNIATFDVQHTHLADGATDAGLILDSCTFTFSNELS